MNVVFQSARFDAYCARYPEAFAIEARAKVTIAVDTVSIPAGELEALRLRYKPVPRAPLGLGDVVALVAQPIARAIDAVAGTNLKECGGCKQRQAKLNRIAPNVLDRR
jgi:hypothetical protein